MANDLDNPGVLVLDTAAVISTTNKFKIRKIVLVAGAAAADAECRNGADEIITSLAAPADSSDEIDFNASPFICTGFELQSISGAGAVVYVYCA